METLLPKWQKHCSFGGSRRHSEHHRMGANTWLYQRLYRSCIDAKSKASWKNGDLAMALSIISALHPKAKHPGQERKLLMDIALFLDPRANVQFYLFSKHCTCKLWLPWATRLLKWHMLWCTSIQKKKIPCTMFRFKQNFPSAYYVVGIV